MTSQRLVPEQRPDKNGHMVTRWVLPDPRNNTTRSAIPPVQPNPVSTVLRESAAARIRDVAENGNYYPDTNLSPVETLIYNMRALSDETISAYMEADNERPSAYYPDLLLSVLNRKDNDARARSILAVVKLDRQIDPEWSDYSKSTYHYDSASKVLSGLRMYKWAGFNPPRDFTDESKPIVQKALALATVAMRIWETGDENEEYEGTMAIGDGNLVSLVLERPEDAELIAKTIHDTGSKDGRLIKFIFDQPDKSSEIIETIRATGTHDIERIREMLATSSSSLRSGAL